MTAFQIIFFNQNSQSVPFLLIPPPAWKVFHDDLDKVFATCVNREAFNLNLNLSC